MERPQAPEVIGRDVECARLAAALADDRPVLVIGEAGIGKTTLVRAAAARTDRTLLEGSAFATLASKPYIALGRALGSAVSGDPLLLAARAEMVVGPGILFLDDLQWVDRESQAIVAQLAGRIGLVVASRDPGGPSGDLARIPWDRITLKELDPRSAADIARLVRPALPPARVARIVELAGGNPLIVEELARDGHASPSLKRAIAARVAGASPRARHLLRLLVVAGRPLPAARLPAGLDELDALGLVARPATDVAVRHALLCDAIRDGIPPEIVPELHRAVAGLLDDPAEAGRHRLAAGDRAAAAQLAGAALCDSTGFRRADLLELAADSGEGDLASGFRLAAARIYRDMGHDDAVVRLLEPLLAEDMEGTDARAWRDALLADSMRATGREQEARQLLDRAVLPDRKLLPGQMELVRSKAIMLVHRGHPQDALDLLDRTFAVTEPLAAGYRMRSLHAKVALYAGRHGSVDELHDAWEAARAAGDDGIAGSMALNLHNGLLTHRGATEALRFAREEASRLEAAGVAARATTLRAEAVQSSLLAGDLEAAIQLGDAVLEQPATAEVRTRATVYLSQALVLRGRFEEAAQVRATLPVPLPLAIQEADLLDAEAEAAYWGGRTARAIDLARRGQCLPRAGDVNLVLPALVLAWSQHDAGKHPDELPPVPDLPCFAGARQEAEALALLGKRTAGNAVPLFDAAARQWARFMRPRELVCRWGAGEAARLGNLPEAVDRLRGTLAAAEGMGFEPLAARIRRSLRLAGVRVAAPRAPAAEAMALTVRERQVVELVAAGLSNTEISRRMGLGRPTVAQAMSRAISRLGVDSRAQVVAAVRRDVIDGVPGPSRRPRRGPFVVVHADPGGDLDQRDRAASISAARAALEGLTRHAVVTPPILEMTVGSREDAAGALLAALEGYGLVALATAEHGVVDDLVDDLGRLGAVCRLDGEHAVIEATGTRHVGPSITDDGRSILQLLARGHSLGEAAALLGLSRRTADRRLAEARDVLGAERTAEAIAAAAERGWLDTRPEV